MEPITAQMSDATLWCICIIAILFVAHFLADVHFSEEAISRRMTKRFRRKLERQRKLGCKLPSEI
tara:strand:- start:587 stop:781 length:195 start_codon:yes stop_codon:yes gene_type:complete